MPSRAQQAALRKTKTSIMDHGHTGAHTPPPPPTHTHTPQSQPTPATGPRQTTPQWSWKFEPFKIRVTFSPRFVSCQHQRNTGTVPVPKPSCHLELKQANGITGMKAAGKLQQLARGSSPAREFFPISSARRQRRAASAVAAPPPKYQPTPSKQPAEAWRLELAHRLELAQARLHLQFSTTQSANMSACMRCVGMGMDRG